MLSHQINVALDDTSESFFILLQIICSTFFTANLTWVLGFLAVIILLFILSLIVRFEVAVFALDDQQKGEIKNSSVNTAKWASDLLLQPKLLLYAIFFTKFIVKTLVVSVIVFLSAGYFNFGGYSDTWIIVRVLAITVVLFLLVEIFLKAWAMYNAPKVVLLMAKPFNNIARAFSPLSLRLDRFILFLGKKIGAKQEDANTINLMQPEEDHITPLRAGGVDEKMLSRGMVKFGDIYAREIMKSRMDVVAVENNTPFDKLLKTVVDCGYSRIPVYIGSFDEIAGILYIKDLLPFIYENENFEWSKLIRPCIFVPEGKKIKDLLKEFQERKILMAIVVDEYGGTSGIITLEDILEEIVGEIYDESDEEESNYSKLDDRNFVFEGKTLIKDFCKITGVDFSIFEPIKGEADTIAGLILELKQEMPFRGESFEFDTFALMVESVDNRRVKRIKATIKDSQNQL